MPMMPDHEGDRVFGRAMQEALDFRGEDGRTNRDLLRRNVAQQKAMIERMKGGGIMRFIAADGTEKLVTLEEVGPDVIVRVNGYGVVAFRGADSAMAVLEQARVDAGLELSLE